MRATLTGAKLIKSKHGGNVWQVYFRGEKGSMLTYIDPRCHNFKRWEPILEKIGAEIDGLTMKSARLVNADSMPVVAVPPPERVVVSVPDRDEPGQFKQVEMKMG